MSLGSITYTKIKKTGRWGLKGTGLVPGDLVFVTKRSGAHAEEKVGTIVFTASDGTMFAEIAGRFVAKARRNHYTRPSARGVELPERDMDGSTFHERVEACYERDEQPGDRYDV